jgi:periplasmic protein TonB
MPIIWPEAMPKPQALLMLLTPPAPVPPPINVAVRPRAAHAPLTPARFTMPTDIPKTIANIVDDPPEVVGALLGAGHTAGDTTSLLTAILGASESTSRPPAVVSHPGPKPNTAVEASVPKRIRTSSLELARLVHRVEPVYPPIAKLAHVSGTVELTAVVGTDGRIRELKALSGNPLLIRAAIDAVSQWIYAPPILNGERVEVIAPVTVNFRLDR